MAERLDSFGTKVEVGDIVLSCPKHKWSGGPTVGQVCGVFPSGRVTMKYALKTHVYAYQRGAPDIDKVGRKYDYSTYSPTEGYKWEEYTYKQKDYTVVGEEWTWVKGQAADLTLIVLRKEGEEKKTLDEMLGFSTMKQAMDLDYTTEKPDLA